MRPSPESALYPCVELCPEDGHIRCRRIYRLQTVCNCFLPNAGCAVRSMGGRIVTEPASEFTAKSGKRKIGPTARR